MNTSKDRITVRVDGHTRLCLTAITLLLAVLIVGLWATGEIGPAADVARAQTAGVDVLPNAAAQRKAIEEAIRTTNRKLDELIGLLKSGTVQVIVSEAKGGKAGGDARFEPDR